MDRNSPQLNEKLDELFAAYRDACQVPEAGANFMPEVWARIDAKRGLSLSLRRWAQAFAVLGAAACLLLGGLMISPWSRPGLDPHTYVEVLEEAQAPDHLMFQEIALRDPGSRPAPDGPIIQ